MQCYTPDHRTISDFRKNNLKEIEKYFIDIVRIFSTLGYTTIGKISIDGTKIKSTDRDANYMKSGGSKDIRPGYNCQAAVAESGIIVAGEAVTEVNDRNQLKSLIEQTESNTQEKVKEVAADCGYGSYTNYH